MAARTNSIVMKDIVSKSKKAPIQKKVEKIEKISKGDFEGKPIIIKKNSLEKELPKNPFFEPRSKEKEIIIREPMRMNGYIAVLSVVVFLAFAFFVLKYFSKVIVSVTPRQSSASIDISLKASSDSVSNLSMDIVSSEDTVNFESVLPEGSGAATKASGKIIVFNEYSTQAQNIIASTRFEAPGGKIYRVPGAITIPGGKMSGGKMIPGQIEITVFADKAGSEYNLGLSDFTIPGFKGTDKFSKIYARSKTEMMGGSAGGSGKIVSQAAIDAALKIEEENFRKNIKDKIKRDLPEGIIIPDRSIDIKMTVEKVDPPLNSSGDRVKIQAHATARAMLLKRSEILDAISNKYSETTGGEKIDILNLEDLNFDVSNVDFNNKSMSVNISGKAYFVWQFDHDKLISDLLKASRGERSGVFKEYPGIERAEVKFSPSWFRFFPSKKDKVDIEIKLAQNP